MKIKIKYALFSVVIALVLSMCVKSSADSPPIKVQSAVTSYQFFGREDRLKKCFVSEGGVYVRVFDAKCPIKSKFNEEEANLLQRLGAPRSLIKGYTVIFTKHLILVSVRHKGVIQANGVHHRGTFSVRWKVLPVRGVKMIVITTNDDRDCNVVNTLRHELGHAAFETVRLSSQWLDAPDSKSCNYDDAAPLKRAVMVPGEKLPPGPIRDKFEKAE